MLLGHTQLSLAQHNMAVSVMVGRCRWQYFVCWKVQQYIRLMSRWGTINIIWICICFGDHMLLLTFNSCSNICPTPSPIKLNGTYHYQCWYISRQNLITNVYVSPFYYIHIWKFFIAHLLQLWWCRENNVEFFSKLLSFQLSNYFAVFHAFRLYQVWTGSFEHHRLNS